MNIIQMLALAEQEQHTANARANGWLGPAEPLESAVRDVKDAEDYELDLDEIPWF